jgi:hypothetical protein
LPVAPAGIALAGVAVALVGAFGPGRLLRRLGSGREARVRSRRRFRAATVVTGLGGLIVGNVLAVQFMQTPALLLEPRHVAGQAVRALDAMRTVPRAGLWIEAPTLGIELPVRDGDGSARIPDWMALHYPGTPEPGQPGDSYLYAHGFDGMFGPLLFAQYGSPVWLRNYTTGWSEAFRITRVVGSVAWNDTAWLRVRTSTPMLTLQTCVGADMHGDRWLVEATPAPATR